jgi:nitrite transporter NirC
MHQETIASLAEAAERKRANLDRSFGSHLVLSALAGMYVGVGVVLVFTIGAPLAAAGSPATKLVMGASFGVALTLVVFAGAELFTGNNMIFSLGTLAGKTRISDLAANWTWTWIGNLAGSALLALLVVKGGTFDGPVFRDFVVNTTATKMNLPWIQLFLRAILANWLVCLAIWQSSKTKSDAAKLGLIFWCLFAFIASGFEHSIANMTLLTMGLLLPHGPDVTIMGLARNLLATTLGNIVGGCIFVALPYWISSADRIGVLKRRTESWSAGPAVAQQQETSAS